MTQELQETFTPIDVDRLRQLLHTALVLRTENAKAYDKVLGRLMECMAPRDFLERTLIKELAYCTWEMARYTRDKTLTMERGFREQRLAGRDREPDKEGLVDQADAIAIELDHVRALEATLGCHERIDKLLMIAAARRNNALEQIERYRNAVVYRLRVASDKIIEAQFNAAGAQPSQLAAPLVPSEAQQ